MPRRRSAQPKPAVRETSLYAPVKRFLETLGFDVKGEICGCDLVALRGDEPPHVVIGELKLGFNLELVLQGIDRSAACDEVWLAVGISGRGGRERDPHDEALSADEDAITAVSDDELLPDEVFRERLLDVLASIARSIAFFASR